MFENQAHDPQTFIRTLREYHQTSEEDRGELASALSEIIISKRVNLAAVRQELLESGDNELIEDLDNLMELIEPYLEDGDVDE